MGNSPQDKVPLSKIFDDLTSVDELKMIGNYIRSLEDYEVDRLDV